MKKLFIHIGRCLMVVEFILLLGFIFILLSPLTIVNVQINHFEIYFVLGSILLSCFGILLLKKNVDVNFEMGLICTCIFTMVTYTMNMNTFSYSKWTTIEIIAHHESDFNRKIKRQLCDYGAIFTDKRVIEETHICENIYWIHELTFDNYRQVEWIELSRSNISF